MDDFRVLACTHVRTTHGMCNVGRADCDAPSRRLTNRSMRPRVELQCARSHIAYVA